MNGRSSKFRFLSSVLALAITAGFSVSSLNAPSQAAIVQPSYDLVVHVPQPVIPVNAAVKISTALNPQLTVATSRLVALDNYGWWGIVNIPSGAGTICFQATGMQSGSSCLDPVITREVWLDQSGTPFLTRVSATKNIKVHLATTNKTARFAVLEVNGVKQSQPFIRVGTTDFVATFPVAEDTSLYTIKTQSTKSKKLVDDTEPLEGDASKLSDIYLSNGVTTIFGSVAERSNLVLIHYNRNDKNYKSWGIHTWYDDSFGGAYTPTSWTKAKAPISSKANTWGVTFSIPLAPFSSKLPFIIHKGEVKDPMTVDQYLDLSVHGHEIWIESGKYDADGNFAIARPQLPGTIGSVEELSVAEATALVGESSRSSFANDSIYFVMTDRYKNGNTANDLGGTNSSNRSISGNDPYDPLYSHGGDLAGLSDGCTKTDGSGEGLPRIKKLGFSAIWITPPFKQNFVQGGSASLHGYWINDFTTIDPHWGTNAEFKSFVDCAHRIGIKVIVDIVMNHTGDVIYYRDGNYGFRNSANTSAFIPSSATSLKSPSWLNDLNNYHNQGNVSDWGNQYQAQNGDFFGLDDIKTENEVVVNGFADVYSTWVNEFGVDGFRIDTAKHVDDYFFSKWWPKMVSQTANSVQSRNQELFAFGEYYDSNSGTLSKYVRKYGLPSVLDFAFQSKSLAFASGGSASNLSTLFDADNSFISKSKSPYDLVTFLGNHDMGRVAWLINQSGATRASSVLLAHDLMFLTRGIPSVYYGDEVGMIGSGGDKSARQDMFPTQVSQWKTEERVFGSAIGSGSSLTQTTPLTTRITLLNSLRKNYPALASGSSTTRLADANTLAISRFDKAYRREYIVAFNSGSTSKVIKLQSSTPSSSWKALLTGSTSSSNAFGEISISVPAKGTVVYQALNQLPTANENVTVTVKAQLVSSEQAVVLSSSVPTNDLGSVTFAVKNGSGPWQRLGTDDSSNFGMTWDYQPLTGPGIASGSKLAFAAIYKSTSGTVSVSSLKEVVIP